MVFGYLVPKSVFSINVNCIGGFHQSIDCSGIFFRKYVMGIIFYELEKSGFQPHHCFCKHSS